MRLASGTQPECVPLTGHDVEAAFALSSMAGWNQTLDDWRMLLNLAEVRCGIRIDGRIVATATLVCYGRALGWIGMVLTHPDFRRRGLARILLSQVMEQANILGIRTLKLDATGDGRPLYESLGFRPEQPVERWQRPGRSGDSATGSVFRSNSPDSELDREACGYDRSELLTRLPDCGDCVAEAKGYALSRPGRLHRYLGPCVALSQIAARSIVEITLMGHPDKRPVGQAILSPASVGWFWDLLPANEAAVDLARQFGFVSVRKLTRMSRGPELRGNDERIFAIAGLELG